VIGPKMMSREADGGKAKKDVKKTGLLTFDFSTFEILLACRIPNKVVNECPLSLQDMKIICCFRYAHVSVST
jgi:hypothetical protein